MDGVINEMISLVRRMDNLLLTEDTISEITCKWRNVVGEDEFFNLLSGLKKGNVVTVGYVSAAKIEVPKGKRLNPATNRMNQFDDYETLGHQLGETGVLKNVIKLSIYNFPWQIQQDVTDKYNDWKTKRDELGGRFGVEFGKARYQTQNNNFGANGGIMSYNGNNDDLKTHTYTNLNMSGIKPVATKYYLVMGDGELKEVDVNKLKLLPYKKTETAVDKLRAAGASEEDVQPLLGMEYRRFEHSHVLFVSATPDTGIPTLLVNNKLSDKLEGLAGVGVQNLIAVAKERYKDFLDPGVKYADYEDEGE